MTKLVFVVDDDENIRNILKGYLEQAGFKVQLFADGEGLLEVMNQRPPDLIVLDIMLPGMNGIELCKAIRKVNSVPLIFISARGEETDRVLGLELGADDYLPKPFSPRELVARVKTIFRRMEGWLDRELAVGNLIIDRDSRAVTCRGKELALTGKEFDLLSAMGGAVNRAFSREELLAAVWGEDYFGDVRAVDDLVKRLRKKISRDAGVSIETVWGYGYRLRGVSTGQ